MDIQETSSGRPLLLALSPTTYRSLNRTRPQDTFGFRQYGS